MASPCITVICQEGIMLNTLLEHWESSDLSALPLELVSSRPEPASVMYQGRPKVIDSIQDYDFNHSILVIFLESAVVAESLKGVLETVPCPVLGGYSDLLPLQPTFFNPGEAGEVGGVIGYGQPVVQALEILLAGFNVESLDLNILVPASVLGQSAVEELASQTARLLNAQSVESKVFGRQLPFNYFPMSDAPYGQSWEDALVSELSCVSISEEFSVNALQAPVFYGVSAFASVVFDREAVQEDFMQALAGCDAVHVAEGLQVLSNQQANAFDGDLLVGNFKPGLFDKSRLDFWFGMDDLKFMAQKCVISHAQFLLKSHL